MPDWNTPDWLAWVRQAERLFDQKKLDEAAGLAEQALRVNPESALAHQVLGLVMSERDRPQEAIPRLSRALALQPDLVPSHNGLGRCYYLLEDLDRAVRHFDTALFLQPDHGFAHFNRALAHLKAGRYREGWLDYEWRWSCGLVQRPSIPKPRWDGCPLNGRSIMVHTEQGLGDVLQFIRFVPLVKRQGGRIVLACQKALQPLLRPLPYIDEWFPVDEPASINFDYYTPLLSLPNLLGIEEKTIPKEVPYIVLDKERVERWRPRIRSLPGFKVGIGWQGSVTFKGDSFRSLPLARFAPLAEVPGVTLVNLQKGPGVEQIEANRAQVPLTVFPELDNDAPFLDTAAIIQHLDLVISSDTALPHLAGALGRPVWVMLAMGCDWRWLMGRPDSPWYPSMRLFRQRAFGDWSGLLREVAVALRDEAALASRRPVVAGSGSRDGQAIQVPVSAGEVLDKISILVIKQQRIRVAQQRANVVRELELLQAVRQELMPATSELAELAEKLKRVNEQLWETEDSLRRFEASGDFGKEFVELARSVYQLNDTRSALKRQVNELLGSAIVEEKSYGTSSVSGEPAD